MEPTPAEAHWQMGQVENNARYLREMGCRIVEDIDVSQGDFQTMLDELTDAKNGLVQLNGYMPRQWVFGLIPRVPGHMLDENSDLPNLDPEGRFRRIAEMRHKVSNGSHRDRGECEDQKEFDWTIEAQDRGEIACLEILCVTGEQGLVCIKHKVTGWDQLGLSELKEEMFGCHIGRQLSSVQRNSYVWHHPQSERCERC